MESVCDTMSHQLSIPLVEDFAEFLGEFFEAGQGDVFGDGHGGSGNIAGDAGHGVGVATQGDGADAWPFQPASTSRSLQNRQVLAVPSPSKLKDFSSLW